MKKLFMLFFAIAIITQVSAQDTITKGKKVVEKKIVKPVNKPKDMVAMRSGKMMLLKDGVWMPMKKKMTMKDGTKVKPDGIVTLKDGKEMTMRNGDRLDIDGKMIIGKRAGETMPDSLMKK